MPKPCTATRVLSGRRPARLAPAFAGLVVEYWVADDRVFYCWCQACNWTGTVVQLDHHIGHEAAD